MIHSTTPLATRSYPCALCPRYIEKGERYRSVVDTDDLPSVWRCCLHCDQTVVIYQPVDDKGEVSTAALALWVNTFGPDTSAQEAADMYGWVMSWTDDEGNLLPIPTGACTGDVLCGVEGHVYRAGRRKTGTFRHRQILKPVKEAIDASRLRYLRLAYPELIERTAS